MSFFCSCLLFVFAISLALAMPVAPRCGPEQVWPSPPGPPLSAGPVPCALAGLRAMLLLLEQMSRNRLTATSMCYTGLSHGTTLGSNPLSAGLGCSGHSRGLTTALTGFHCLAPYLLSVSKPLVAWGLFPLHFTLLPWGESMGFMWICLGCSPHLQVSWSTNYTSHFFFPKKAKCPAFEIRMGAPFGVLACQSQWPSPGFWALGSWVL